VGVPGNNSSETQSLQLDGGVITGISGMSIIGVGAGVDAGDDVGAGVDAGDDVGAGVDAGDDVGDGVTGDGVTGDGVTGDGVTGDGVTHRGSFVTETIPHGPAT
jgi:hypothetical protein